MNQAGLSKLKPSNTDEIEGLLTLEKYNEIIGETEKKKQRIRKMRKCMSKR